jgi:hypothetical protein
MGRCEENFDDREMERCSKLTKDDVEAQTKPARSNFVSKLRAMRCTSMPFKVSVESGMLV